MEEIIQYRHAPIIRKVNALLIPVTLINRDMAGAKEFNKIYHIGLNSGYRIITRTPSGGISQARGIFRAPCWDARHIGSHLIELTFIDYDGMWRIQFRTKPEDKKKKYFGRKSFATFKEICQSFKLNIDDYAITPEEGLEAKKQIESPLIQFHRPGFAHKIFTNVHHIDFRSSYPTGLINTHPEFREVIKYIYDNRFKDNAKYKMVLNASIGMMQSRLTQYRWAHLARDAIMDNNNRVRAMAEKLINAGNIVLLYNTDGIWYCGDIYHDDKEGDGLGSWHTDHKSCKFRAKSAGAYEFIEDGKYHVRLRGETKLDKVKPRSKWEWGDIYHPDAEVIEFEWKEGVGLLKDGEVVV